jgi:hypothetical protein
MSLTTVVVQTDLLPCHGYLTLTGLVLILTVAAAWIGLHGGTTGSCVTVEEACWDD